MTIETDYSVDAGSLRVTFTPQSIAHYANGDDPVTIGHDFSGNFYYGLMTFQLFANRYATIVSADLVTTFNLSPDAGLTLAVYADAADNSPWTNDLASAYAKVSNETTAVTYPVTPAAGTQTHVNVAAILQEIVNRVGWVPGQFVTIVYSWNAATDGFGQLRTVGDVAHGPFILSEWTGGDGGDGGGTGPGGQTGVNASALWMLFDSKE